MECDGNHEWPSEADLEYALERERQDQKAEYEYYDQLEYEMFLAENPKGTAHGN